MALFEILCFLQFYDHFSGKDQKINLTIHVNGWTDSNNSYTCSMYPTSRTKYNRNKSIVSIFQKLWNFENWPGNFQKRSIRLKLCYVQRYTWPKQYAKNWRCSSCSFWEIHNWRCQPVLCTAQRENFKTAQMMKLRTLNSIKHDKTVGGLGGHPPTSGARGVSRGTG